VGGLILDNKAMELDVYKVQSCGYAERVALGKLIRTDNIEVECMVI
jgi:hypothetical protein